MKPLRVLTLIAPLFAVFALAACGETTLDAAKVEDKVRELAEGEDVEVDKVECPDDVKSEDGDEFECDVETEDGVAFEAEVEHTSSDGDVRVRIAADELARASGGGETEAPVPAPAGGEASGEDAELIEQAVRSFVRAARDGDAATFCGQQTDARLARRYGDFRKCVESEEATMPDPGFLTGDTVGVEITALAPPRATVSVGSPGFTYEMVDEGGKGRWAIDAIDGE